MQDANKRKYFLQAFLCGVIATITVGALGVALAFHRLSGRLAASAPLQRVQPAMETGHDAWGQLEVLPIPLVNSGHVSPEAERLQPPKWFFENFSEQQLIELFASCRLTDAQRATLFDKSIWSPSTNGYVISPPQSIVQSLSSDARATLYSALSKSAANYSQRFPFRFSRNVLESSLAAFGVSTQAVATVYSLAYTDAQSECFADLEAAREELPPHDFQLLIETLYETPVYFLRLRVTPKTDINRLVEYWGVGGRTNLIRPLLTALSRAPEGGWVNVSYLLPPFPRLRLYTYATEWKDPGAAAQDCFFTALNFFNEKPDTNFLRSECIQKALSTEYSPVSTNIAYGDVVLLLDDADRAIHAAVYIADDFVFTKNGVHPSQPWALMKVNDMLRTYYRTNPGKMQFMRRNGLVPLRPSGHLITSSQWPNG